MQNEDVARNLEQQLAGLKEEVARMRRRERRANVIRIAIALAVALPTLAWAAQIALPHTFVNGAVADADEVNANFGALVSESNDQDTRLTSLETASGSTLTSCIQTGYVNSYNAFFSFTCPAGRVLTGVTSVHDNGTEDRLFNFRCCSVEPN